MESRNFLIVICTILIIGIVSTMGCKRTQSSESNERTIVVNTNSISDIVNKALEEAYFEGQKDALDGIIAIAQDSTNTWYWTRSPWDSGKEPLWDPAEYIERDSGISKALFDK